MDRPIDVLLRVVRQEILKTDTDRSPMEPLTGEMQMALYTLAKKHSLAGLVGQALEAQGLLKDSTASALFQNAMFNEIYHYEKMNFVYHMICDALEEAQIPYLPLKGAILRQYYPQPWMRTSGDIDILVPKNWIRQAEKILADKFDVDIYKIYGSGHDISFYSKDGIHVELHYDLMEDDRAGKSPRVLKKTWEHARSVSPGTYRYVMDDAMFYFYHIAHLSKHFEAGGCGIRFFLDTQLLLERIQSDRFQVDCLLKEGSLLTFEEAVRQLCQVWFSGKEHDTRSRQVESFVLDSGIFGTLENVYINRRRRYGGTVRYFLSRVFIPYQSLKDKYPIVKRWPILTPVYEVYRLFQLLFGRKRFYLETYFKATKTDGAAKAKAITELMDMVGL